MKRDMMKYKNLVSALRGRFPNDWVDALAKILSSGAEKGSIKYEEINLDEDIDILLLLFKNRMIIPSQTSRSLAWEDRIILLKPGEKYIIPPVIRNLIQYAKITGEWKPELAVAKYLNDIGEEDVERVLEFFRRIREQADGIRVYMDLLLREAEKLGLEQELGRIIAEFKGGGILSPSLRNPSRFHYEINPSLLDRENRDR